MALERTKRANPTYYQQVLNISNGLSISQRQYIQKIIDNIKANNGAATDRQYDILKRLETGNFKYDIKN